MNLEEKFKHLQKKNRIRIMCNEQPAEIDKKLNVKIEYSCGKTEKIPFLKILEHQHDYEALLHGDSIFQKTLRCGSHCRRRLKILKLKPLKSERDLQEIWNLEHGRNGIAQLTIQLT